MTFPSGLGMSGKTVETVHVFRAKAPEDWRSPKAVANTERSVRREASWTAPVLWRFLTGAMALNTCKTVPQASDVGVTPLKRCVNEKGPSAGSRLFGVLRFACL